MIPDLHSKVRTIAKAHPEYTLREIGEKLGLTRQRIHQVVQEVGRHHYKLKQKGGYKRRVVLSKSSIQAAIKNKVNQKDFVKKYRTSARSLKSFLDTYGLVWPKNIHTEKVKLADLKKMILKHPNYCLRELAVHFNITEAAVSHRIRCHGLSYTKKYTKHTKHTKHTKNKLR